MQENYTHKVSMLQTHVGISSGKSLHSNWNYTTNIGYSVFMMFVIHTLILAPTEFSHNPLFSLYVC